MLPINLQPPYRDPTTPVTVITVQKKQYLPRNRVQNASGTAPIAPRISHGVSEDVNSRLSVELFLSPKLGHFL